MSQSQSQATPAPAAPEPTPEQIKAAELTAAQKFKAAKAMKKGKRMGKDPNETFAKLQEDTANDQRIQQEAVYQAAEAVAEQYLEVWTAEDDQDKKTCKEQTRVLTDRFNESIDLLVKQLGSWRKLMNDHIGETTYSSTNACQSYAFMADAALKTTSTIARAILYESDTTAAIGVVTAARQKTAAGISSDVRPAPVKPKELLDQWLRPQAS